MSADQEAKALLEKARESEDDLDIRLLIAAAVQRVSDSLGLRAIVTGGTVVDFYAGGATGRSESYPAKWQASHDVDIVAFSVESRQDDRSALLRALEAQLGLEVLRYEDHTGKEIHDRAATIPGLPYGIELVGFELNGDPLAERTFQVRVENQTIYLRGPEDTVIAYAESGWDTRHRGDWTRALAVYRAMRHVMVDDYLQRRAQERGMPKVLEEVKAGRPLPPNPGPLS